MDFTTAMRAHRAMNAPAQAARRQSRQALLNYLRDKQAEGYTLKQVIEELERKEA